MSNQTASDLDNAWSKGRNVLKRIWDLVNNLDPLHLARSILPNLTPAKTKDLLHPPHSSAFLDYMPSYHLSHII